MKIDAGAGDCFAAIDLDLETLMVSKSVDSVGIMFAGMGEYAYLSKAECKLLVAALEAAMEHI